MSINHDLPKVKIYPPVVVTSTLAFGLLLQFMFPLPIFTSPFLKGVGGMIALASLLLIWWNTVSFEEAGTPHDPLSSTSNLVLHGPHEYSRNPTYLAYLLLVFGVALWTGTPWLLITDVVQYFVLLHALIIPEEHYLARKFGERYQRYAKRVRRWL